MWLLTIIALQIQWSTAPYEMTVSLDLNIEVQGHYDNTHYWANKNDWCEVLENMNSASFEKKLVYCADMFE